MDHAKDQRFGKEARNDGTHTAEGRNSPTSFVAIALKGDLQRTGSLDIALSR
jgi:hypothetical protein